MHGCVKPVLIRTVIVPSLMSHFPHSRKRFDAQGCFRICSSVVYMRGIASNGVTGSRALLSSPSSSL